MPWHDVQQGETLLGLAEKNHLEDWRTIIDHPDNAALKEKRTDPGILRPGDRVFIPNREMREHASAVDQTHSFRLSRPKAWVRIAVKDDQGEPCADKRYVLEVEGETWEGNLGSDGVVEQAVPVDARKGRLEVWTSEEAAGVWELEIGSMDPIEEVSGIQARLANLGIDPGPIDGACGPETTAAIETLQRRVGLEVTGAVDGALSEKLAAYYDPGQDERDLEVERSPAGESAPAQP